MNEKQKTQTNKTTQKTDELSGTLEKIVYKSSENGFSVFRLKAKTKELITVTGILPEIHQGEFLQLKGHWKFHPKFGHQFVAKECSSTRPSDIIGIQRYLASGLIKGIGPKFAEKIVDRFGANTLEIIDNEPEKLFEVSGVGKKRVELIIKAWEDQKEISKVMVFLRGKNVSTAFAVKIYKKYGNQSIELIESNPYRIVDDIWGIGFKSADSIALNLGFEKDSIYRIQAGILHSINEATKSGHLYVKLEDVKTNIVKLLELEDLDVSELTKKALRHLYNKDRIKLIEFKSEETFNVKEHFITLPQFYFAEKNIAKKILRLNSKKNKFELDLDKIYNTIRLADENNFCLNEQQQAGILTSLQNRITIITGGPGTGKTTLVKKLLEVIEENKINYKLAAPTGRAAKRMFESTHRNTSTLHRLLEFNPSIMNFNKNEFNALDLDFLIIDEASMIDVFLMNSVLKAIPDKGHLILLGDVDQLPSVGPGNILKDLIDSEKINVVRLTEVFRQAQDSMIIINAHKVNIGEFPTSSPPNSKRDFFYIKEKEPENIFPLLRKIYKTTLPKFKINPKDAIVLTPMNRGLAGTTRINQELQEILNPGNDESKQVMRFGQPYKIGDRVMQIRNNYDKFVFNGDMGIIDSINKEDQKLFIKFNDRVLEYDFAELSELLLSYSVSIHKSQGSEFSAVIIPIFMQHFMLLQRNLIYTAITRAKKLCILIGEPRAIAMGIKNNKGVNRNTFLKEFLTSDLEAK